MISKDLILNKIKELTQENRGQPPGMKAFVKATGIGSGWICGRYWVKWSDAVAEAGCQPNRFPERLNEELICLKIAEFIKELGRYPSRNELSCKAFKDKSFPPMSAYISVFGCKFVAAKKILDCLSGHEGFDEVKEICNKIYLDGIAEDESYAKDFDRIRNFLALVKRDKSRYVILSGQKPFMVKQLKLQGVNVIHQIAAENREYALNLLKEKYKSCYNKVGDWYSFNTEQLTELKKCYYIKGFMPDK